MDTWKRIVSTLHFSKSKTWTVNPPNDTPGLEKSTIARNAVGFWFLGMCTTYAFMTMLSAAHDILTEDALNDNGLQNYTNNITRNFTQIEAKQTQCNTISTGVILLCTTLPPLIVKFIVPFIPVTTGVLVVVIALLSAASYLIVALARVTWLALIGTVLSSLAVGLGEPVFLRYSVNFYKYVVASWAAGTGGSAIIASLSYAAITALGVKPRTAVLIMLITPIAMIFSFWIVVDRSECKLKKKNENQSEINENKRENAEKTDSTDLSKMSQIKVLLNYMIPLALVYFAEYFINQGLMELIQFHEMSLTPAEQYRWLIAAYQVGVFLSRTFAGFFNLRQVWIMPVLQFINLILFLMQAIYRFIPNFWILFVIVLYEGCLGGAAYVSIIFSILAKVPEERREFTIAFVTAADSVGVALAGALAIPVHDAICQSHQ